MCWQMTGRGQMRVGANVRRYFFLLFASIFMAPVAHAAVCDPNAVRGPYGFSLTGQTTIGPKMSNNSPKALQLKRAIPNSPPKGIISKGVAPAPPEPGRPIQYAARPRTWHPPERSRGNARRKIPRLPVLRCEVPLPLRRHHQPHARDIVQPWLPPGRRGCADGKGLRSLLKGARPCRWSPPTCSGG